MKAQKRKIVGFIQRRRQFDQPEKQAAGIHGVGYKKQNRGNDRPGNAAARAEPVYQRHKHARYDHAKAKAGEHAEIDLRPRYAHCGHDDRRNQRNDKPGGKHDNAPAHRISGKAAANAGGNDKQRPEKRLEYTKEIKDPVPYIVAQHKAYIIKHMVKDHTYDCKSAQLVKQVYPALPLFHLLTPCLL